MLNDDLAVREYLRATDDTFWQWQDDGEAIVWRDGKTIAFRDEAAEVLGRLAPRGLPPFSAVLLLLAATRDAWSSDGAEAGILAGMIGSAGALPADLALLAETLAGLNRVHSLPWEMRRSLSVKAAIAEIVFEAARWTIPPQQAPTVVTAMRPGLGDLLDTPEDDTVTMRGYGPALLKRDLGILLVGLKQVDPEAIQLRLTTGLLALPAPAELDLPAAAVAFNLIGSLADDDELAGLGRVAKRLLVSASLPRRLSAEPEQELGGYSDIANRGSLDRLLASELAHDNLTLAVRVAMNEALYLRRESPPSKPQQHRAVLIDAGIRTWGIPRVFAAAAGLAFAATLSRRGSINFYRAHGGELASVELLTRPGLAKHLESLEPDLHLADAAPAFFNRVAEHDGPVEAILLTTEDGLADASLQSALRRATLPKLFVATVNRDGRFRLYERGPHGAKQLHEANLDLNELLAGGTKLVDPVRSTNLPAIFSAKPFPLFLSHDVQQDRTWFVEESGGAFSLTTDGRLTVWAAKFRGARQLCDRLPAGKLWWASPLPHDGPLSLVIGTAEKLHLVRIDTDGRQHVIGPLPGGPAKGVAAHQGVLFVVHRRHVAIVSQETGELLEDVLPPAGAKWRHQRFFQAADRSWYVLSHDGRMARFDEVVPAFPGERVQPLISVFECVGQEGPIGVNEWGNFASTTVAEVHEVRHGLKEDELQVSWVSNDGRRIQLALVEPDKYRYSAAMIDVVTREAKPCGSASFDDRVSAVIRQVTLRRRFVAAGVTQNGDFALLANRGRIVCFQVRNGTAVFALDDRAVLRKLRDFEPLPSEFGYKLAVARWDDGSRCVLDSRGLLHLQPANRSIPETTLVLSEGELAAWVADGRMWGRPYFVGVGPNVVQASKDQLAVFQATVQQFARGIDA
jgi:hypothetical protein